MGAMSKYQEYFIAVCEQRYKLSRYRRELSLLEELRAAEELRGVQIATEILEHKTKNVRGYAKREEDKEALRNQRVKDETPDSVETVRPRHTLSFFKDMH